VGKGRADPPRGVHCLRDYRARMGGRFASFTVSYEETDLWIGVDPASFSPRMEEFSLFLARRLRLELDSYIATRHEFVSSLAPIAEDADAPEIARAMIAASALAGVGPMAAVAGAVAERVGASLAAEFGCRETIVENGGDLWLLFEEPMDVSVYAGDSPLSERVGVSIAPNFSPLGLCTSSGTIGPSLSLGKADAAMVACADAALADAFATRLGNAVQSPKDIEAALELATGRDWVLSALVVVGDKMGIRGELPLRLFS
jgi:uncharacterized protein